MPVLKDGHLDITDISLKNIAFDFYDEIIGEVSFIAQYTFKYNNKNFYLSVNIENSLPDEVPSFDELLRSGEIHLFDDVSGLELYSNGDYNNPARSQDAKDIKKALLMDNGIYNDMFLCETPKVKVSNLEEAKEAYSEYKSLRG